MIDRVTSEPIGPSNGPYFRLYFAGTCTNLHELAATISPWSKALYRYHCRHPGLGGELYVQLLLVSENGLHLLFDSREWQWEDLVVPYTLVVNAVRRNAADGESLRKASGVSFLLLSDGLWTDDVVNRANTLSDIGIEVDPVIMCGVAQTSELPILRERLATIGAGDVLFFERDSSQLCKRINFPEVQFACITRGVDVVARLRVELARTGLLCTLRNESVSDEQSYEDG